MLPILFWLNFMAQCRPGHCWKGCFSISHTTLLKLSIYFDTNRGNPHLLFCIYFTKLKFVIKKMLYTYIDYVAWYYPKIAYEWYPFNQWIYRISNSMLKQYKKQLTNTLNNNLLLLKFQFSYKFYVLLYYACLKTNIQLLLAWAISIVVKIKSIHTTSTGEGIRVIFVGESAGFTVCNGDAACCNIYCMIVKQILSTVFLYLWHFLGNKM